MVASTESLSVGRELVKIGKTCNISVCEDEWTPFLIGDKISCFKTFGHMKLNEAITYCESFNAKQILPRSTQESDDLLSALLSLNLDSDSSSALVSIGIYKTKQGDWHDSSGQPISYFNWLSDEPDDLAGKRIYAGFRIDKAQRSARWADYSGIDELNVVCTKRPRQGQNKN